MDEAGALGEHGLLPRAAMMERVVHQRVDVGAADGVDRRERVALEAQRRHREPERLDEALEAVGLENRPDPGQGGAQSRRLLRRVLEHLAFVQRAHDETGRARGRGERGERLGLAGALVVPHVERIERVDAPHLEAGVRGLGAHPASGFAVLQAVVADVVAQFDRDGAEPDRRVDQLVGRQRRIDHVVEAELDGAGRHGRFPEVRVKDRLGVAEGRRNAERRPRGSAAASPYTDFRRRCRYWSATTAAMMTPPLMISW